MSRYNNRKGYEREFQTRQYNGYKSTRKTYTETVYKSYRTELNPTPEQKKYIEAYFKICTEVYNRFISYNLPQIEKGLPAISKESYLEFTQRGLITGVGSEFFLMPQYSVAVNRTLQTAEKALDKYVLGKAGKPRLKKKGTKNISLYFRPEPGKYNIWCDRHRIRIPYLGWIRLKEKGYIPYRKGGQYIVSGWIKKNAGRYYVSAQVCMPKDNKIEACSAPGIGIDLNINNFATISDGTVIENINKTPRVQRLKKRVSRLGRSYARKKITYIRIHGEDSAKGTSGVYLSKNSMKNMQRLENVYFKLDSIRTDFLNKNVSAICNQNYKFIALEDLKVSGMADERRYSKYLLDQDFYKFRLGICRKCKNKETEVRMVNQWYPSSKTCHECGAYFKALTLDDRVITCPKCGVTMPRDLNAALNIRDAKDYYVWNSKWN